MHEKVQLDFIIIYDLKGECVLLEMLINITKQSVYNIFPCIMSEQKEGSGLSSVGNAQEREAGLFLELQRLLLVTI